MCDNERKKVGNITGTVIHLYKNQSIYEVNFPHFCVHRPDGRDSDLYKFPVKERGDKEHPSINVYFSLTLISTHTDNKTNETESQNEINIVAGRAVFKALGGDPNSIFINTSNYSEYLYNHTIDYKPLRKKILDYIDDRYERLFDKQFLVYEIVIALTYDYKEILSQIKYLIQEKVLSMNIRMDELYRYHDYEFVRFEFTKGEKFEDYKTSFNKKLNNKRSSVINFNDKYPYLNIDRCNEEFQEALNLVESNPDKALRIACSYLESIAKHILDYFHKPYPENMDVQSLVNECIKYLRLSNDSKSKSELVRINRSILNIASGIGTIRTHFSDVHGKGMAEDELGVRHARYIVALSRSLSIFLIETLAENLQEKNP